jgi:hypothetical protein
MSLKRGRKYFLATRFGLPLGTLYATGFAVGKLLYRSTGHLGLLYGPLGDLRRTALAARPRYGSGASENWILLVALAILLFVLGVELRHHADRRPGGQDIFFIAGLCLGAISIVGLLMDSSPQGPPLRSDLFLGLMALSGVMLTVGSWRVWDTRIRFLASLVWIVGVAMALWAFRTNDQAWVGSRLQVRSPSAVACVRRSGSRTRAWSCRNQSIL